MRKRSSNFRRGGFNRRRYSSNRKPRSKKSFDPSMLIGQATIAEPIQAVEIKHKFTDFDISHKLKNNIANKGYATPTPIQDQVIPQILLGKDVVGLANTGTGKTAAFLIPLIEKITQFKSSRVLIITPTRELAAQIQDELQGFSPGLNIHSTLCIGGVSINGQLRQLKRRPQFLIGTPGRIKDLSQNHNLQLKSFETVVLDEVDQMLDMGFIHDIKYLIGSLSQPRHSLFFSATLPDSVRVVMDSFLKNPVVISVKTRDTLDQIDQEVIKVDGRSKVDILDEMLSDPVFSKVLIFGSTKWKLNKLEKTLRNKGYRVSAIHGNKSQSHRQRVLGQFKKNRLQALLATDVVSRGIDIDDITHVINFDMPQTYEDYIHRIGRTGRASKTGKAITLVD